MKNNYIILILLFSVILSLNSCKVLRPTEMFQTEDEYPISNFEVSKKEYVIQPYDKIAVRVVSNIGESLFGTGNNESGGNTNMMNNRNQQGLEFPVEYDGLIKLPIVGRVNISGKTVREAEEYLENLYGDYYVDPFVLLQVTNRKVMIFMDSGTSASIVEMPTENLTLIEAIAQSGGLTQYSKAYKIKLIRGNLTENPDIYYWNIANLSDLKDTNIYLEANDIIYIDSRPRYVNKVLSEISPYLTLTTTLITAYGLFFTLNN